jgi:hypothetical protein
VGRSNRFSATLVEREKMNKVQRRLTTAMLSLLLALGMTFMVAPNAQAVSGTISGTVECVYGNNTVNGIHIDVAQGKDGFASWTKTGPASASYSYTLSQNTSSYFINVGCGGSPSNWGATFTSPNVSGSYYNLYCVTSGGQRRCALG